jgi:hypothetical protein
VWVVHAKRIGHFGDYLLLYHVVKEAGYATMTAEEMIINSTFESCLIC